LGSLAVFKFRSTHKLAVAQDCWIVVHRKVFNLTKLLETDHGACK